MTEENKKINIKAELERADEALRAADILMSNGLLKDAVSRLYYFVLHTTRALLLTKELEPKSHEGVLRIFGLHFVREGIFEPKDSHAFSKIMKFREEADYNPAYIFTEEDFVEYRGGAQRLSDKIREYLRTLGYH